ncbi:MAG: TIGR01458 family HAD-type hydrolase, partial [Pseudomonadota bacterium]
MRGVLLDISGVLIEGGHALPGALEAVEELDRAGLPHCYLTNTTQKDKAAVCKQLEACGFPVDPDLVLTPAGAAIDWLTEHGLSAHLLIHPGLAADFARLPESGDRAVVMGDAGQGFTYDALNQAFRMLDGGAPFLALAHNRVFRDADGGLSLDTGAFVTALEYASGTTATVLGKPAPAFFATGAAALGLRLRDCAMIGDDAESDVAGALRAGAGAAYLTKTGKYHPGQPDTDPAPTATVADVSAAVDA